MKINKLILNDGSKHDLFSVNPAAVGNDDNTINGFYLRILIYDNNDVESIINSISKNGILSIITSDGTVHDVPNEYNKISPLDINCCTDEYLNDMEIDHLIVSDSNVLYERIKDTIVCTLSLLVISDELVLNELILNYKNDLIRRLSNQCHSSIENGLEIILSDGNKYVFSYKSDDRENIKQMFDAVVYGATSFPYHENGSSCRSFSACDIVTIYSKMIENKTHHTTYFNQLKKYVNDLSDPYKLSQVVYGMNLNGEYLDEYELNMLEAERQMNKIISKIGV